MSSPIGALDFLRSIAVVSALSIGVPAVAGLPDQMLTLDVSSSAGAGNLSVRYSDGAFDAASQTWSWSVVSPVALTDAGNGATIATLRSATLTVRGLWRTDLSLELDAGAVETTVAVATVLVTFSTIEAANAAGQASCSVAVQDMDANGFNLHAVGDAVFHGDLNGAGTGATHFASLMGTVTGDTGGNANAFQREPSAGYRNAGIAVNSMSSSLGFVLSARDRATVATSFRLQPATSASGSDAADSSDESDSASGTTDSASDSEDGDSTVEPSDADSDAADESGADDGDDSSDAAASGGTASPVALFPACGPAALVPSVLSALSLAMLRASRRPLRRPRALSAPWS